MYSIKNIGVLVKGLRKGLLLGLVLLCIGLGAREIYKGKENQPKEIIELHIADWGTPAEKLASELDLPIFFSIKNKFRAEAYSEDLIKKNFVYTELDPKLYPGDYAALKALHCNIGKDTEITCGVMTSKMYPILTSTNPNFKTKGDEASIETMLKGIISIYHDNYNRFLKMSKQLYILDDIPNEYHIEDLKDDSSKLTFMLDFGYHERFMPAQLSEAARLTFRNCTVEKYSPSQTRIKNVAYNEIADKLKDRENLGFIESSFYARALADYILIFNDKRSLDLLLNFANEILAKQDTDGSFTISGSKDTLYNAFSITILSYAYKITGNPTYANALTLFSNFLENKLNSDKGLDADFQEGGVSGAKGYVYLSRAILNAYIVTLDEKHLEISNRLLTRLNRKSKKLNSMTLELPEESPLSKYMNLCSVEDTQYTSTNGVLLQIYKDMQTLNLSKDADVNIKNILKSSLNSPYSNIDFDFSFRIAKYSNPLISVDTLEKLPKERAKSKGKSNK